MASGVHDTNMNKEERDAIKPCVGCGYCCQVPCWTSVHYYGRHVNQYGCPALSWNNKDGRHYCDLAVHPQVNIMIGVGCCSPLNSWRKEVKDRG